MAKVVEFILFMAVWVIVFALMEFYGVDNKSIYAFIGGCLGVIHMSLYVRLDQEDV